MLVPNLKKFFILGLISSLGVMAGSIIAPIEARYIGTFTHNPVVIGSVFGVGSVFFVLLSYWLGRMSDIYGRRRIILLGFVSGGIYAVLYASALTIFSMYGVKLAWAFAAIASGPIMSAYLQDFLSPFSNKGRYFGYVYSAQAVSGSVGALLGGYIATTYGLTAPFYLVAALYVLIFLVTFFGLPEGELLSTNEHTIRKKNKRSLIEIVKIIVSKPELLFYMSVNTSFGINWGIKSFLWPLVIFQLAKNDLVTGSVFATMGFLASLLLPFAGRFVDRFGSYRMILFELVILGTSGVGLALSGSITFFWVCAAIYTVGEVVNGPAQAVLLTENIGQDMRGEMMGLDATLDQLLAVLSPFLAGFCITIFGLTYTLLIFMLLFWMSFMLSGYIYITKIRKHF